jgi:predicted ATP-grasp superfamily ATP-dependent carboligase
MHLESLTGEIEDWLEKADEETNLKFLKKITRDSMEEVVAIEILGYYGSVGKLISEEIQKISMKSEKLAGFFSSFFSEMIQISYNEILLPISILKLEIGVKTFILTTSSFAIPDIVGYSLAEELLDFYKKNNVSKIILVDGVYNDKRRIDIKPQVHNISSSNFNIEVKNQHPSDFTLMGQIACSFLTYWRQSREIPIEILAVDAFSEYDPISSLELIKILTRDWGIENLSFTKLKDQSHEFTQSFLTSRDELGDGNADKTSDPRYFI